jgi:Fe-S-cluster containining protein
MKRTWRSPRIAPAPRLEAADLQRADERLRRRLDGEFAEAARKAGRWLVCRPGCSECCRGPFPITRLDVWRLRRGLEELKRGDPSRATAVISRAAAATTRLAEGYPGDPANGRLEAEEAELDLFFERHGALACPALDPERETCDLYAWRPVSCRTYGPPVRFAGEQAPACRFCFDGASPETVEACRMEPDREGLEEGILAGIGVTGGDDWETVIAFALQESGTEQFLQTMMTDTSV